MLRGIQHIKLYSVPLCLCSKTDQSKISVLYTPKLPAMILQCISPQVANMGSFPILCIRKPAALSLSPSIFVFWLIGIFTCLSKHSEDCFVTGHLVTIQIQKILKKSLECKSHVYLHVNVLILRFLIPMLQSFSLWSHTPMGKSHGHNIPPMATISLTLPLCIKVAFNHIGWLQWQT